MTHRRSYQADPTLGDRVFDLLDAVWPGVPLRAARAGAEGLGAPWEEASTPFVVEDRGAVVSHVGLLPLPLFVGGREVVAGGVHGVATHPARRRRGHCRAIMDELLAWAEPRYETLVLTTAHPEYFQPFGFRVVSESAFARAVCRGRTSTRSRALDLGSADDRSIVRRLLGRRAPLSEILSAGREQAVWAFAEAGGALRYSAELDAVVAGETRGATLALFDVVAATVPSLQQVADSWPDPVEEVIAFFTPDRLATDFRPEPHDLRGGGRSMDVGVDNTCLMARGPFVPPGAAVMLGRPARC
jgi:predicted N-acetyltransferase YhbS